MEDQVIKQQAFDRIKVIHRLSQEFNHMVGKPHHERLLELMHKHVAEIQELFEKKDPHYMIETGDLLILCFELLLEGGTDIDEVALQCFDRYERKLNELINNVKT